MAASNKFCLVDWFISEGITPHWPANSVWSDLDDRIKGLRREPSRTPIGEIFDILLSGESHDPPQDIPLQYTLSAAPVIATYIDWGAKYPDKRLHDFMWSSNNVIAKHPLVARSLRQYLAVLEPGAQYHEIEEVARKLMSNKALPDETVEVVKGFIDVWSKNPVLDNEYLEAIAVTMLLLEHPIYLPTAIWDALENSIAEDTSNYIAPAQVISEPYSIHQCIRPELMLASCTTPYAWRDTPSILALWYAYLPYVDLSYQDQYTLALVLASNSLLEKLPLNVDEHSQLKTFLADTFSELPNSFMERCKILEPLTATFSNSFLGRASLMNTMAMENPPITLPLIEMST